MTMLKIPEKCVAGIVENDGPRFKLRVGEARTPEPGPTDLLLRLSCTGLCMSDVHYMLNDTALPPMSHFGVSSPGHEGVGIVVKVGLNVTDWKVGDRAGVGPIYNVCNNCEHCLRGREQYCRESVKTGLMVCGTYQQYILSPASHTCRIPDGVPDEVAAPIMCSASTMHAALADARLQSGDYVVLPGGGGGLGAQGVQLARAMGFKPIVVDSGHTKRSMAMSCGAEAFVDYSLVHDVLGEVQGITNGGAHCVIITAWQAYSEAVEYIGNRIGGVVVCVGIPPNQADIMVGASPTKYITQDLRITGALIGSQTDAAACLAYARRGLLKPICEVRGMDRFVESVEQLRNGKIAGRIVIRFDL